MSDQVKIFLISAGNTFLATFVSVVAVTLQSGIQWTTAFWVALALAAVRAAVKAVVSRFVPVSLGGVKGVK